MEDEPSLCEMLAQRFAYCAEQLVDMHAQGDWDGWTWHIFPYELVLIERGEEVAS
jgi:hypothetical protein